jgi:hypothetical protein
MTAQAQPGVSASPPRRYGDATDLLDRADRALAQARAADGPGRQYCCAHVAALRAAAAVLAVRTRPGSRRGQRNAWELLTTVAPELGEWAAFFAAGAAKRAAAECGASTAVTTREADDLVRDVEHFVRVVEEVLGLARPLGWRPWLVPAATSDLGKR